VTKKRVSGIVKTREKEKKKGRRGSGKKFGRKKGQIKRPNGQSAKKANCGRKKLWENQWDSLQKNRGAN